MQFKYICNTCGQLYNPDTHIFRCRCGGLLDIKKTNFRFSKSDIMTSEWSIFRYLKSMPFDEKFCFWKDISMGEGLSPLVMLDKDLPNLMVKMDYMMPTLSFKDRGAAVLISKAKELGIKKIIQDSSGNAGTSIAAYAGRAGIACDIYVPENTTAKKVNQIAYHGANVHLIEGSREDTAKAALEAVEEGDGFYASHVYNPFFYEGTKTFVYEIFEQLDGNMPDALIIPTGNGTLLLGAYYGLKELFTMDLIDRIPRLIAVQSENCAPIYKAFKQDKMLVDAADNIGTIAEGIAIAEPKRGKQILEAIRATGGEVILAPENKILDTRKYLAKKGFYVEPTTAATFAAFFEYNNKSDNKSNEKFIIPFCGAGLKV
ncbi:MAG: pyridoxal-phosphate dependent enzyme [Eubacteriales bacterium]|nr:pyridoxal-phosphate dependent enzyme [Eubacteriales bacterium]